MSSFEPLHFNPALVTHVEEVREAVLALLAMNGGYKNCDFSRFVQPGDINRMVLEYQKPVIDYAWELVRRGAGRYLCFPDDEAARWVTSFTGNPATDKCDFATVTAMIPKGYALELGRYRDAVAQAEKAGSVCAYVKPDPDNYDVDAMSKSKAGLMEISQRLATVFYQRVETETYVRSMELNFLNYRKLRTASPCVHDPVHVFRRLQDPTYEMTDEDCTIYFATHRGQSFSNMMAFATNEIKTKVIQEQDAILAISNAYTSFKDTYAFAAETVAQSAKEAEPTLPTVRLGSSLDGLKM